MESRNYAWPVTAVSKESYEVISEWSRSYAELIQNKKNNYFWSWNKRN